MLQITIPERELWNEFKEEFVYSKEQTLKLEHSLISISKWEAKWKKPYISKKKKTYEEYADYVRCMTLNQNVDPNVYYNLSPQNIEEIDSYIADSMTASTFSDSGKGNTGEYISAETIYYMMISFNIPFECEKWHFSRLMALIKMCSAKNSPAQKMSQSDTISKYAELNAKRRKELKSKG